jgi:hypothetical protein
MYSGFFRTKHSLSPAQSLRVYWLYLVPFVLGPLISLIVKVVRPAVAPAFSDWYFLAYAVLAIWPVVFKDASNKYRLLGFIAWFVLKIVAVGAA